MAQSWPLDSQMAVKNKKKLESSKSSIKDLFNDVLNDTKGFKHQITLKVMLKKTSRMVKLNSSQFISIQQQKQ